MIRLIFIDVEGKGPAAGLNDDARFEWGAVDFSSWMMAQKHPIDFRTFHRIGATEEHFRDFQEWITDGGEAGDRYVMVTDNVAYDWQFINHYMHRFLGQNVLGHSARRIGDFAAGMLAGRLNQEWPESLADFLASQTWKQHRITKHTHHPVDDALGNVEAFAWLLGWRPKQKGLFE